MSRRLCNSDAIQAGELLAIESEGEEILLARTEEGKLYALQDRCPHQSRSLAGGSLKGSVLTCRHHGVQIELSDGALLYSAGYIGLESVPSYAVEERDGTVWLESPPDP